MNSMNFVKFPEKDRTARNFRTPGQEKIQTHGKQKQIPAPTPGQHPLINWAWCLWYGIFTLASLG